MEKSSHEKSPFLIEWKRYEKGGFVLSAMWSGTLLLTATGLFAQVVGFLYRMMLSRLIGAETMGLYQLVMPVYSMFMSVTAVGLTVAVSTRAARCHALGDEATTEDDVFRACGETVLELVALVSLLVREFRATDVIVTADHGFTYTYEPLSETDKVSVGEADGLVVESGKRYVVGHSGMRSDALLPVSLADMSGGALCGLAPRELVRVKRAGGGENYVHGGISLQELCVPVLRFRNFRSGSRGFAERTRAGVSLVSPLKAITNLSFSLDVLQDAPAVGKTLPATYELFVRERSGGQVTDSQTVTADLTDDDPTLRTFRVRLHVREAYAGRTGLPCQLVAHSANGDEEVLAELTLQIAFASAFESEW